MPADQAQRFDLISVRGVIGMFFLTLEQLTGQLWINRIANTFESNQDFETYGGLGNVPQMREWVGSKQSKTLKEFSVKIGNKDFESTLEFKNKDLRRDKTNQVQARIGDLATRAVAHDALLLSAIIDGGTSTTVSIPGGLSQTIACYDGQPLFSASHLIGPTSLNNSITLSLTTAATTLGTVVGVGTTTAPSPAVFALAIQSAIQSMYAFKDDQGQPLNEFASKFIIMVPPSLSGAALQATSGQFLALGYSNPTLTLQSPASGKMEFTVVVNNRLTWTNQFAIFIDDAMGFKPLMRQVEALSPNPNPSSGMADNAQAGFGLVMKVLAQGSDYEFLNNAQLFSVEKSGFVGYGRFDEAILCQFVS